MHEALFAELGERKAQTERDSADLTAYQLLVEKARAVLWTERSNTKKTKPADCEAAYDAMVSGEEACLDPLYNILHRHPRSALCFSGGGIRSATFSLGVLHALAKYSFAAQQMANLHDCSPSSTIYRPCQAADTSARGSARGSRVKGARRA